MPQNQPFEIPQQLREVAERNVEQARTAYGQLMDAMAQATGMWMSAMSSNEGTSGFKVVQERAIQLAKQNAEACFAAASELANAKDIQDLLAIQSRSAQTQMQAYALQAQELGRLMVEAAQSVPPEKLKPAAAQVECEQEHIGLVPPRPQAGEHRKPISIADHSLTIDQQERARRWSTAWTIKG